MPAKLAQAQKSKRQFIKEFAQKKPFSDYINGVGLSRVGLNFRLEVLLRKSLPNSIELPKKYQGTSISCRVVGKIKAL